MIIQYVVLFLYFAVLFGIGIVASRRISDLADFFVGGKKLGYWVVAFSARATGESAWLLLGLTGLGAFVGLSALWVVVGEVLGVAIAWFIMAKPFKAATDRFESITIPDFLVSHFAEKRATPRQTLLLRAIAAGALTLFVTVYVSAQIDATGKAFVSFLNWHYYPGVLVGFAIVVAYTFAGGFVAVAWSDLFQGTLMLAGLLALPLFGWLTAPSSSVFWQGLADVDPSLVSIWGAGGLSLSSVFVIISYLAVGLGFLGSPQVFVRFMSLERPEELRKGRWVAVAYTALTDTGAVFAGMFGRYLLAPVADVESVLGVGGEWVLPELVSYLFPALVVALYIAAVLAAIMSTIDSLLVVASSAATRDFYQQIFHPDIGSDQLTGLSRVVTLALAFLALLISIAVSIHSPDRTVFWYVIFGWSGIAATFCPTIILMLFYRPLTATGALSAMLTGMVAVPLLEFGAPLLPEIGPALTSVGEMAPAFALSAVVGVFVSTVSGD